MYRWAIAVSIQLWARAILTQCCLLGCCLLGWSEDKVQKIADVSVFFDCVSQWEIAHDMVVILSTDFLAEKESIFFEVNDNSLHGPFGDSNLRGNFTDYHIGLISEQNNDMGVIGEESPTSFFVACLI